MFSDQSRAPRARALRLAVAALGLLALAGCEYLGCEPDTPERSEFDPDSIKLKEWCSPDESGEFPKGITKIEKGEEEEYYWSEGGGCVHRPIREAWAILHDIPYLVGYKTDRIDEYELVDIKAPDAEGVTHQYEIVYTVHKMMTIEWTMLWTHELLEGTYEEPEHVVVNYRRTEGSRFMPYWEGNMVLERVTDDVTAVFIHDEIKTMESSPESSARATQRYYKKFEEGEPDFEMMKKGARGPAAPEGLADEGKEDESGGATGDGEGDDDN